MFMWLVPFFLFFFAAIDALPLVDGLNNRTAVSDIENLERKPPPPPGSKPGNYLPTKLYLSCGFAPPTAESWKANLPAISAWIDEKWIDFLWNDLYSSFPEYMRDTFAPGQSPGSMFCDGLGACSITHCDHLRKDLSPHDKQMAFYVFEQLSGINHMYESIHSGLTEAAIYMLNTVDDMVNRYSIAPKIEKQIKEKRKQQKLLMSVFQGLGLMTTGALGPLALANPTIAPFKAVFDITLNTYISTVGVARELLPEDPELSADLSKHVRWSLNELQHAASNSTKTDMKLFMEGEENHRGQTLSAILKGEAFFGPDTGLQLQIQNRVEQMFKASIINALWGWERSYIVATNTAACEYDYRGPAESRVCLPERPGKAFWLYALDSRHEWDARQKHDVEIHSPTGYRNFFPGQNSDVYGLTKDDIVRSSLFVHEHELEDAIERMDITRLGNVFPTEGDWKLGNVPGAFALPVCTNPGGEAISSVWGHHGRNYPCMCGNFGWKDGTWSYDIDETKNFLILTGLMYSEDFGHFCHQNSKCKAEKSINWRPEFEALSQDGDPKIPEKLNHPSKKCKLKPKHLIGHPEQDAEVQNWAL
jgi:hypothetical protein